MATVGETSILGTGANTGPNKIVWFRFTASASFTAQSMYMYAVAAGFIWDAGDRIVLGIYSGDATDPDALLGQTGEIVSTGVTGWVSANLASTVEITDGAVYWLAFFSGDITGWIGTNSGSRNCQETTAYSTTMPATYGGAVVGAWSSSIYASSSAVPSGTAAAITGNVIGNPSPTTSPLANLSPVANVLSNPSPSEEVYSA